MIKVKLAHEILEVSKVNKEILQTALTNNGVMCDLPYQAKNQLINLNEKIASLDRSQEHRKELRENLKSIISEYQTAAKLADKAEAQALTEKRQDIARTQKAVDPLLIDIRKLVKKYSNITGSLQAPVLQYPPMSRYEQNALMAILSLSQG